MSHIRVRFAPSPTGYLHIGNVRTALFNHLFAQRNKGELVLRIEDTDQERSKPEYTQQIMKDLGWLGIRWNEGPDVGGPHGPYEQSKRLHHYREACDRLIKTGRAYYCFCSTEDLEQMKKEAQAKGLAPKYDNRCSKLSDAERNKKLAEGIKPSIRFKVEECELEFEDIIRGPVKFDMGLFGDFVILRPDGMPTFHLAVCVDDGLMKISHVIRGEDHLPNTPRHIQLFRAMGFEPPKFAHLSLIMGKGNEPLSKRLGAMSVQEYRQTGYLPDVIDNYIALLGWAPGDNREIFSLKELEQAFSLDRVGKSASIFDLEKLNWLSGEHLRQLSDDEFFRKSLEYLKSQNAVPKFVDESKLRDLVLNFKDNIVHFDELIDRLAIFDPDAKIQDSEILNQPQVPEILKSLKEYFEALPSNTYPDYETLNQKLKSSVKAKGKELFLPLRVAITFRAHGPELKRILPHLSKDLCLKRLYVATKQHI